MNDLTGNIQGELLPHILSSSDWVAGILLCCFLIVTYVLSVGRHTLGQLIRDFFSVRERNSIFNEQTAADIHCRLMLILAVCLLTAIFILDLFTRQGILIPTRENTPALMGAYTAMMVGFVLVKCGIYGFINWIFFDKTKSRLWMEAFLLVFSVLVFPLFPVILLLVYFDSEFTLFAEISGIALFILAQILLLYKCFSIFFNRLHGLLFLIVYFCTLEALPYLVLWKGFAFVNEILK